MNLYRKCHQHQLIFLIYRTYLKKKNFDLQNNIMENQDFRLFNEAERNICTENYVFHGEYQLDLEARFSLHSHA